MALAGRLGASIDLDNVITDGTLNAWEKLYSESASRLLVTVAPDHVAAFEALFASDLGVTAAYLGTVDAGSDLVVRQGDTVLITVDVDTLAQAFKRTLQ